MDKGVAEPKQEVVFILLISHAFENYVGHCTCISTRFVLKSKRVKGRT